MDRSSIFLGGFMASGKTSVGKFLADRTKRPFLDTDVLIESREGMSISEIFSRKGEEYFRGLERDVIREVCEIENSVIALGGGVLVDPYLKSLVRSSGKLAILSVRAETVLQRAEKERGKRPLLERGNIEGLLEQRADAYGKGDLIIETDDLTIDRVVERIVEQFGVSIPLLRENITITGKVGSSEQTLIIGSGLMGRIEDLLPCKAKAPFVISDLITGPLFGPFLDFRSGMLELPRGEEAKSLRSLERIYSGLHEAGVDRYSSLLSLGGGTVGDVAGFAAATWMRGIGLVNCPTTLLAQIDSSIGGKNGINLPGGKNLAGTFYQPWTIISDVNCLLNLSNVEFRQGLAEVVKYGLGHDERLFSWLDLNAGLIMERRIDVLIRMVEWCTRIKLAVVSGDEKEKTGERARLNLGHTVAHGIEAASGYSSWKHGDAVSVGMLVSAYIAVGLKELSLQEFEKLYCLLRKFGLPLRCDLYWEKILPYLQMDKKFRNKAPRIVLPMGTGNSELVSNIDLETIKKAYREVMHYGEKTGISCC